MTDQQKEYIERLAVILPKLPVDEQLYLRGALEAYERLYRKENEDEDQRSDGC